MGLNPLINTGGYYWTRLEQAGYGYEYKNSLKVGMLGLVDDMLGVTEADFTAQLMNALINEKTASKGLQFGVAKCKYMVVADA